MQPYFLPYIGYFQLIAAVDKFILLDDVNYINRGRINRNQIEINGQPTWFTIPLVKASQNKLIQEIEIAPFQEWRVKMIQTFSNVYAKADFKSQGLFLLNKWLNNLETNLSKFIYRTILDICQLIGLETEIIPSSAIYPKKGLSGQERILDICRIESAKAYINLPGGRSIYDKSLFEMAGTSLRFITTKNIIKNDDNKKDVFIPSFIDDIMRFELNDILTKVNSFVVGED